MKSMLKTAAKRFPPAYRLYNKARGIRLHSPDITVPYIFLGSDYGGWAVPRSVLSQSAIAYSVGVGEDISFDLALAAYRGMKVYVFDPTPVARSFITSQVLPPEIEYLPVGLAEADGVMTFAAPRHSAGASYSRPSDGATDGGIACEVLTLNSIQSLLAHVTIDLLKIDIEGSEYAVIKNMLSSNSRPACLLVEFHHKMYGYDVSVTQKAVSDLRRDGYKIFWVSDLGREYGFIRR